MTLQYLFMTGKQKPVTIVVFGVEMNYSTVSVREHTISFFNFLTLNSQLFLSSLVRLFQTSYINLGPCIHITLLYINFALSINFTTNLMVVLV